jgi:hypothetical protein
VLAVSVSIDGLRETHDRVRALGGSFDAAMASVAHLREAGVPVYANTQINRWNAGEPAREPDAREDWRSRNGAACPDGSCLFPLEAGGGAQPDASADAGEDAGAMRRTPTHRRTGTAATELRRPGRRDG